MSEGCAERLPSLEKRVSAAQIRRYSEVSGDYNPVHLDEEFAAASSFGRIVAHGMMTLAFVSEMLTAKFGRHWLASGALKARFKRPAYPGDVLRTSGDIIERVEESAGYRVKCKVRLVKADSGEEALTGEASLYLPKE